MTLFKFNLAMFSVYKH